MKDILSDLQKDQHKTAPMTKCPKRQIPAQASVGDLETLVNLVYYREVAEVEAMTAVLQEKVLSEGKKFYDVWMHEVSDNIQSLAIAYSERFCLQAAMKRLEGQADPAVKSALAKVIRLHCLALVKENLGWYLAHGVVNPQAGLALDGELNAAVKEVLPHTNEFLEAFNIPRIPQLAPPIIRDYVKFNEQGNPDDVNAAGDFFDFRQGPKL